LSFAAGAFPNLPRQSERTLKKIWHPDGNTENARGFFDSKRDNPLVRQTRDQRPRPVTKVLKVKPKETDSDRVEAAFYGSEDGLGIRGV
jgi:hypothetical protein